MSDLGLIFNIYKHLKNTASGKKKKKKTFKWAEKLNRNFSKIDIQIANWSMKRCSTSLTHQGNANPNHNEMSPHTCKNTAATA